METPERSMRNVAERPAGSVALLCRDTVVTQDDDQRLAMSVIRGHSGRALAFELAVARAAAKGQGSRRVVAVRGADGD
jgi:hypothetical protein